MFVMLFITRVSSSSRDIEILKEDESAPAISNLIVMLAKRVKTRRCHDLMITKNKILSMVAGFACSVHALLRLD